MPTSTPAVQTKAGFWPSVSHWFIATIISEKKLEAIIMPAEKLKINCIKILFILPKQKTIAPPKEVIKKANKDVKTVSQIGGNCNIQHNIKTCQFLLRQGSHKVLQFVIFSNIIILAQQIPFKI